MAITVRTRFDVFKRDEFTCQYCGRKSPDVVLEVDHIEPRALEGSDDLMNLRTSCWDCNRGKADKPLHQIVTGEDPHDRAVLLLEQERQLREYNAVLARQRDVRDDDAWDLVRHWNRELGSDERDLERIKNRDFLWLFNTLQWCPKEKIREFMDYAIYRDMTKNFRYLAACCRNWRYEHTADRDWQTKGLMDELP